jgi:hypothetical protein
MCNSMHLYVLPVKTCLEIDPCKKFHLSQSHSENKIDTITKLIDN